MPGHSSQGGSLTSETFPAHAGEMPERGKRVHGRVGPK